MTEDPTPRELLIRLCSLEKRTQEKFATMEQTTRDTRTELNHRLEGMNEFRAALKDQSADYVSRKELDIRSVELQRRLGIIEDCMNQRHGARSISSLLWAIGAAVLVIVIGGIFTIAK